MSELRGLPPTTGVIVERANKDCWRVIIAGELVGFANRMSNGGWCAFDSHDRRVSPVHFQKPMAVGKYFLKLATEPSP